MNLQRIKKIAERKGIEFKALAYSIGMSEGNLHRCVRENRIQAQDLEKISTQLKVSIIEFFDEEEISTKPTASKTFDDIVPSERVRLLQLLMEEKDKRIRSLQLLMEEKDERIAELKERIAELKSCALTEPLSPRQLES